MISSHIGDDWILQPGLLRKLLMVFQKPSLHPCTFTPKSTYPFVQPRYTTFRKDMLEHIRAEKRITSNMVLFVCTCCRERFPTFHPLHMPPFKLDVLASYPWEVSSWDETPPAERKQYATLHTGTCQRCAQDMHKISTDDLLPDVPLRLEDDTPETREMHHIFNHATVVEDMFIALNHMLVSVCTVGRARTGVSMFRKNIISFPQELNELKHMEAFLSNITRGDIVNVRLSLSSTDPCLVHRARVVNIEQDNDAGPLLIEMSNGEHRRVQWRDVEQRLKLPWKPESLRDYLIVLRRRDCRREDYVEDLKVRRKYDQAVVEIAHTEGTLEREPRRRTSARLLCWLRLYDRRRNRRDSARRRRS